MATEFKLNYTGSEINAKLATVDETKDNLANNYYTSTQIDTKFSDASTETDEKFSNVGIRFNEIDTQFEGVDTKLESKADLIDGKVPIEQLPDGIGDLPDHTHDISDIEGLFVEETKTTFVTVWEYSNDMISDMDMPQDSETWSMYSVSDNTSPNSWIGSIITTIEGDTFEITEDNITMTLTGVYNIKDPVNNKDYMIVITSDLDPTIISLPSGTNVVGTYAVRSSGGWGISRIDSPSEITVSVIVKELLPEALQIGESGTKIEWDGTPTEEFVDVTDTLGVIYYKLGEYLEKDELIGATIMMSNGEVIVVDESMFMDFNEDVFIVNGLVNSIEPAILVSLDASVVDLSMFVSGLTVEVKSAGLWFCLYNNGLRTCSITGSDYQLKQLDPKYIPANLDFNLSDYYTKTEIDKITGDCNTVLDEISALIGE